MVMSPSQRLDATFAALADPTRRAILARLASGQASVTELTKPFAMTQPAISKHLKVLERAGLISRGRDAQRRPCRLEAKPMAEANRWLEEYRNTASCHAHGPGNCPHAGLRRAPPPCIRRVHQARVAQALVRTARLVA